MDFEEGLALTQERLTDEADNFAELLEGLRSHVPPGLIGNEQWHSLLERVSTMPPTMAAFPFGFELPLHDPQPTADLGISLVGGTSPASYFEKHALSAEAGPSARAIARLLRETDSDDSPLRHIVGRKMMLEYDIGSAPAGVPQEPGIFLRPAERPIIGDGHQSGDVGIVLDSLVTAVGWDLDPAERKHAEKIYRSQEPDTRIDSFGAFPSRGRAIRLAVTGFRTSSSLGMFLERIGWPGQHSDLDTAMSCMGEQRGIVSMGAHLDILARGTGPTLGLSFLAKERMSKDPRYWLDSPDVWMDFLDTLRNEDLAVPEKLSELAKWSSGPTMVYAKSGPFILLRGIHHIKLVLYGGRLEQAKGYAFMALIAVPPSSGV